MAVVSAGAIFATPISAPPDIAVRTMQLAPTAKQQALLNPFDVFQPVVTQTIVDVQSMVQTQLDNPVPIARQLLTNQLQYLTSAANTGVDAAVTLSNAALQLPSTLVTAATLALNGKPQEALDVLAKGTLVPALEVVRSLVGKAQEIVQQQLAVAMRLVEVIPQNIIRILTTSLQAGIQIIRAGIGAAQDVVAAVFKGSPVGVVNAITTGLANVAMVAEQVTIGGSRYAEYAVAADGTARMEVRRMSIRESLELAQRDIASALRGGVKEKAVLFEESAPAVEQLSETVEESTAVDEDSAAAAGDEVTEPADVVGDDVAEKVSVTSESDEAETADVDPDADVTEDKSEADAAAEASAAEADQEQAETDTSDVSGTNGAAESDAPEPSGDTGNDPGATDQAAEADNDQSTD